MWEPLLRGCRKRRGEKAGTLRTSEGFGLIREGQEPRKAGQFHLGLVRDGDRQVAGGRDSGCQVARRMGARSTSRSHLGSGCQVGVRWMDLWVPQGVTWRPPALQASSETRKFRRFHRA